MDKIDDEFLKRINATFRIEADEHLNAFSAGLIELEKPQSQERYAEIIEAMFREIHSLKGAARSVDKKDVESICHPLESVFSALKRKEISLTPASFDLFFKINERLSKLITQSDSDQTATERQLLRELVRQIKEIGTGNSNSDKIDEPKRSKEREVFEPIEVSSSENLVGSEIPKRVRPGSADTVRIRISKLDPLLLQAEELIQSKKAINQRLLELQDINTSVAGWKTESAKWKSHKSLISSALWSELSETSEININNLESQLTGLTRSMERDKYNLDSMVDNHLEAMRQILMLPFSSLAEVFPGMVRKISGEQGKEIDFVIKGAELEIDKRILDELKDPLIHLIRNSIDHGIGKPQERILQNKPQHGTIILVFTAREGGMIEIMLSDNGNGINKVQLLNAAIKSGNLTREAAGKLDQKEILSLIYKSGVSTSPVITDISGRGLGMSIVREKIEKLNGKIAVETEENKGTTVRILLPMTLTTFRGILVRIDEFLFILPTMNVERVLKVDPEEIKTIENHDTLRIDDQILSVSGLGDALGLTEKKHAGSGKMEPGSEDSDQIRLVVIASGAHRIAFRVDEVVDEQQVLVKSLGKLLRRVKNISGATILGSGKVVPVVHIPDLIKSALLFAGKTKVYISPEKAPSRKILVADDSITSRTLIKNILETAGYSITTAIDGIDAYTRARSNDFDLIVSDVDMPRMNGFELIMKIRNDKILCELPVVLVTALESREDRERGIEVGADAYIVKSSFDQANLLEVIKKLI
jgi:two-component system chemotaxis sensor kinase CheA